MSLRPDESRRRGRSKSPGRRDELEISRSRGAERSRSRARDSPPSSRYGEDYRGSRDRVYEYEQESTRSSRPAVVDAEPRYSSTTVDKYQRSTSPMPGGYPSYDQGKEYSRTKTEEVRYTNEDRQGREREKDYYESTKYTRSGSYDRVRPTSPTRETRYEKKVSYTTRSDNSSDSDSSRSSRSRSRERESDRSYERRRTKGDDRRREKERDYEREKDSRYYADETRDHALTHSYGEPRYAPGYSKPETTGSYSRTEESYYKQTSPHSSGATLGAYQSPRGSQANVVTAEPGASLGSRMHSLSISTGGGHSLAVAAGAGRTSQLSLANAPGSPLLEAYHGTYQSISPMPSPLMLPSHSHSDISQIESLSLVEASPTARRRHARFHDPADDAATLADALKGERRAPHLEPLIEVLPSLTHEQIMDLRVEYKLIVKTPDRKGVNIAKHIKMRLKEEDPALLKACYATALGKWESEAYWANFWYQGEKSRRELLIESLFGRTNAEIRAIKDGFSDKKYSNSLSKCMKVELKEDKFKKAVMTVLEERRMEDRAGYAVDRHLVDEDVRELYRCIKSERGGESAMIEIIVTRSDSHIREILRVYDATYRSNFARDMLKKSGNLVGELLAHILNGVINKPVRDALLLHHALSSSTSKHHGDSLRTELLISRLIRYHWDRPHMEAVKREYRNRYNVELIEAVRDGTKGDWGEFCVQLCITRIGDDVKRL